MSIIQTICEERRLDWRALNYWEGTCYEGARLKGCLKECRNMYKEIQFIYLLIVTWSWNFNELFPFLHKWTSFVMSFFKFSGVIEIQSHRTKIMKSVILSVYQGLSASQFPMHGIMCNIGTIQFSQKRTSS